MPSWLTATDTITPTLMVINMLRGHKMMQGEVEDINKLERAGVGVCMPMRVCDIEGEYLWQVKRGDFKRACKILGC